MCKWCHKNGFIISLKKEKENVSYISAIACRDGLYTKCRLSWADKAYRWGKQRKHAVENKLHKEPIKFLNTASAANPMTQFANTIQQSVFERRSTSRRKSEVNLKGWLIETVQVLATYKGQMKNICQTTLLAFIKIDNERGRVQLATNLHDGDLPQTINC